MRFISILSIVFTLSFFSSTVQASLKWLAIEAPSKERRTELANLGVSMERVVDDTVYVVVEEAMLNKIKKAGFKIKSKLDTSEFSRLNFPDEDSDYHDYNELIEALSNLIEKHPDLVRVMSIGKTVENRSIWAIRINSDNIAKEEISGKPGVIFMGGHHSREHLSVEVPLRLAQHLADNYGKDEVITHLLNTREVFIIPAVNPDGLEYDISKSQYLFWRKNRSNLGADSACMGVDLNRNYSYKWGTVGSSSNPCSETYHGSKSFSEPESSAIKNFLEKHINIKILISFHTFSELILYPWGHTYNELENKKDLDTHIAMAQTMARWNGYAPMQSSSLYAVSGDTTDWSYGVLGMISFTFELSPKNSFAGGGFYPGDEIIEPTFNDNLRPALYLIDLADDPYRAVRNPETTLFYESQGFLNPSFIR